MRLLGKFEDRDIAESFHLLLESKGIESFVEEGKESSSPSSVFLIWVINEDKVDEATSLFEKYTVDPSKYKQEIPQKKKEDQKPLASPQSDPQIKGPIRVRAVPHLMRLRMHAPLTKWIVLLCIVLFAWNSFLFRSEVKSQPNLMKFLPFTKLDLALIYDIPYRYELLRELLEQFPDVSPETLQELPQEGKALYKKIEKTSDWQGIYFYLFGGAEKAKEATTEMFRKIREGQVWRTFTPCLLHKDFLHILFNMLWLWVLGREVEQRVGKIRFIFLLLCLGIISNTAQYLMAGPYFVGFSGIICGLGGFIWIRQRCAPWEGYTVHKATLLFLLFFVLAMVLLQVGSIIATMLHWKPIAINIANTAHVVGGLCGMLFAKIPVFYRMRS